MKDVAAVASRSSSLRACERKGEVALREKRRDDALCACNRSVGTFEYVRFYVVSTLPRRRTILKVQTVKAGHPRAAIIRS